MRKCKCLILLAACVCMLASGCTAREPVVQETPQATDFPQQAQAPVLPDNIRVDQSGVPVLKVYVQETGAVQEMTLEEYLRGVLAGEMKNDWPQEALKAQAILARTFVIKFIMEKESKYDGADISTDITEAQAYDESGINDRIREAVDATRGMVVCYNNEPIYAWFHAHSGGLTTTAAEGLDYKEAAPYTQSVDGMESEEAPADTQEWSVQFPEEAVLKACRDVGVNTGETISSVSEGEKYSSGRLRNLLINGVKVPANEFRIAIGSSQMKSTMVTNLSYADGTLAMSGRGYGHGVGMSQWGAYAMASLGQSAEKIIHHYFKNVDIVQMWE